MKNLSFSTIVLALMFDQLTEGAKIEFEFKQVGNGYFISAVK